MTYRFLDHTGDFAIEVEAEDIPAAYALAARALLHLITDAPERVRESVQREVSVTGVDPADVLVALGNELLYLFEVERFLCARLEVHVLHEDQLDAVAFGETFDASRHPIARPAKAVTHHGAVLEDGPAGRALARFVVDL